MSVVALLRQNDPTRSSILIRLRREVDDSTLAQALEQNEFVTHVELDLTDLINIPVTRQWPELLRVIATREQLETVRLECAGIWGDGDGDDSTRRARAFVLAIQQNSNVRSVAFASAMPRQVLTSFLDHVGVNLKALELTAVTGNSLEDSREVALALQRNTSIESLTVWMGLPGGFMQTILDNLVSNAVVKRLVVSSMGPSNHRNTEPVEALAIQRLLEATTSIRCFELTECRLDNGGFPIICQGLLNSRAVSDIKFDRCSFVSEQMANEFNSILQRKANLRSLSMTSCYDPSPPRIQTMLAAFFLRGDSPLRCFKLEGSLDLFLRNGCVDSFLAAIAKSKLESFSIGRISSQQQLGSLTNNIPEMKLKDFEVVVRTNLNSPTTKEALLEAVRNNFCLRSVVGKVRDFHLDHSHHQDLFDEGDKQRLEFYFDRNQQVVKWVKNPATVRRVVWPEALKLAERAGPNTLFQNMRALSGVGIGLKKGKRKRGS